MKEKEKKMKFSNYLIEAQISQLGKFDVEGTKILVTDPCYDLETRGQMIFEDCEPGMWNSAVLRQVHKNSKQRKDKHVEELKNSLSSLAELLSKDPNSALTSSLLSQFKDLLKETEEQDYSTLHALLAFNDEIVKVNDDDLTFADNGNFFWKFRGYVGVDSGQMSISDFDFYSKNPLSYEGVPTIDPDTGLENRGENGPYWEVVDITIHSTFRAGVYKNKAVVSSTDVGDGDFRVFAAHSPTGKICAIAVLFQITCEDEEISAEKI